MNDEQLEAFVTAAAEGVSCDGLSVGIDSSERADEPTYSFATPSETFEDLEEAALRKRATENPWFVSNWYYWNKFDRPDAETAFLRWLEHADDEVPERYESLAGDGIQRSWGQLHVEVGLGEDGNRMYGLCHEADAARELTGLSVHADPLDAREITKYDDRGRYRPLKTAPSLQTGWAFIDLDGRALARTIDLIYPATVANWHLEREGELDVSHYRETAERQTGIYDVIDELPEQALEWVAESCCVDSQCLKRREWDEDDETELDVPRGEGEFPCREPCSVVVAAARKWTQLENEETQTYEFELTPSEKEQLEDIIDAVAEGSADDIREADIHDGANRYRTRYLRAKRVDEAGQFCGVPTDES